MQADYLADVPDLLADVERRYQLAKGSLEQEVNSRLVAEALASGRPMWAKIDVVRDARLILLELPDTEFLTVLEHAVGDSPPIYVMSTSAGELVVAADEALQAHGCAYRLDVPDWPHFEWIGDPKLHSLVVAPALAVLADGRVAGARAEFEEALNKRRAGTPKDLEDAVDEAAKSVESMLKVLHDEHSVARPSNEVVSQLFKSLKEADVLPQFVSNLVTAVAGPRNNMASHGQGGTVREVPEELADASIAAAATAITFLAHYLR